MQFVLSSHCVLIGIVALLSPLGQTSAEDVVVRPRPMPGPLNNPLKGWCPYTDAGEIHQPYSMVFKYISWRELEPVEGQYQFEQWESTWDVGRGKGKHIIFRVYVDYPSLPSGLPDWLRNAGVKETAYKDHGGGRSPDYNHPQMVAAMERLIAALGKRYNQHPRIAFVQAGLLGFWGEWHTWPREKLYASPDTERRIIEAYRKSFPDKSLMVRYAKGYAGKQSWIGFHDDMFPEDTDNGKDWSFLSGLRTAKRTANWKVAVVGGEMVPNKAKRWLGKDFDTTLTMLNRSHFTWVGPYCPALENPRDEQFEKRSEELVRKMGYEFRIGELRHRTKVKTGQSVSFSLDGENLGVAPFYYPWPVELVLLDSSGKLAQRIETKWDIRTWMPGTSPAEGSFSENTQFAVNVPAGTYLLGLGIRDPWQDRPVIRFANDLPVTEGWTNLSKIQVTP